MDDEAIQRKVLYLLHVYKYGKTALQAGKTMRRSEGIAESAEIMQLIKQDREAEKLDSYIRGISYATSDAMRHDSTLHLNRMEGELARLLERQKRLVVPTNSKADHA